MKITELKNYFIFKVNVFILNFLESSQLIYFKKELIWS